MCLSSTVIESWPITQEVTGSSPFNDKYFLPLNSANSVKTFRKNSVVPAMHGLDHNVMRLIVFTTDIILLDFHSSELKIGILFILYQIHSN